MAETWRSPRRIEEEVRQYRHDRFESLMEAAGTDEQKRKLAFWALRQEIAGEVDLSECNQMEEAQESI